MYSNRHTLERKTTKCDHRLCALYDYEDFGSIKSINRIICSIVIIINSVLTLQVSTAKYLMIADLAK